MNKTILNKKSLNEENCEQLLPDIKPQTKIATLQRDRYIGLDVKFSIKDISMVVGIAPTFIKKICGQKNQLSIQEILLLLDQDSFNETIVPRSMVIDYLLKNQSQQEQRPVLDTNKEYMLLHGHALEKLSLIPKGSVKCIVTSTPYWGLRI